MDLVPDSPRSRNIGGSDIHTGLTAGDDNNFFGAFAWMEPDEKRATMPAKENKEPGIGYKGWQSRLST